MTIQIEISPETEARLATLAAARRMDVPAYAATLLERATENELKSGTTRSAGQRHSGRKSLAQLFADSPFKGLDVDFERDPDIGRDIAL